MKRKFAIILVLIVAAAFYFGWLKFREPSLKQIERALPVQVNTEKTKEITEIKEKTKNAISAASKELKKPEKKSDR